MKKFIQNLLQHFTALVLFFLFFYVNVFSQNNYTLDQIGGFEGNLPSFWNIGNQPSGSTLTWAADQYLSMGHSIEIQKTATSDSASWISDNMCDMWSPAIPANVDLLFGAWIKTSGINTNPTTDDQRWYIAFSFYDDAGSLIGICKLPIDQTLATSSGWTADTTSVGQVSLPKDAFKMIISFVGGKNATGTVWADNFIFTGRNGVWAGQDWNTQLGVPTGWYYWLPPNGGYDGLINSGFENTVVTNETSHVGNYSLKYFMPAGRAVHDGFVSTHRLSFNAIDPTINPGDIIRISVWVKGSNLVPDSAAVHPVDWAVGVSSHFFTKLGNNDGWDGTGNDFQFAFPNATSFNWTKYSLDVQVPTDPATVGMEIRLHVYSSFTGTIYFDDLSIKNLSSQFPLTTIANARNLVGDTVTVTGVVISPNYQTVNRANYIWDGTAGIEIFKTGLTSPELKLGDSVKVIGQITIYNGLTEIVPMADGDIIVVDSNKVLPNPQIISIHEFNTNGEEYESHLIKFLNLTKISGTWPTTFSNKTFLLTDGVDTLTMYLDNDINLYNYPEPNWPSDVIGIGTQFSNTGIGSYELNPRFIQDFHTNNSVVMVPPGDGTLSAAINYYPSGSVLQLLPGGLYTESNNYNFGVIEDKKLTIEVPGNNPQKAILKINKAPDNFSVTSFFMLSDGSSIILKNLEVDGSLLSSPSAFALLQFYIGGGNPKNTKINKIEIESCDIHDLTGFVIDGANSGYAGYLVIDSTVINNSIIHNVSTSVNYKYAGANFISLTNSTLYNILSYGFRIGGSTYTLLPDNTPEVTIDHTTWNNIGISDPREILLLEKGPNARPWSVTNSIFSGQVGKTRTVINLKEMTDSTLATISNTCLWDIGKINWLGHTVHDTITMNPQFKNADEGNFTLPDSSVLLTFGTDGGPIGDPRWQKSFSGLSISGRITYDNIAATPLANVNVILSGQAGAATLTDANGNFSFNGLANGSYQLHAVCFDKWGGANATDALVVLLHTIQNPVLSGIRLAAADVNTSGDVNSTDALLILRRSVGLINAFAAGDWIFDSPSITLNDTSSVNDIKALNVGDVNGSNVPGISKSSPAIVETNEGSIKFTPGEAFQVVMSASEDFEASALTLIIKYPDNLVELQGISSKLKNML